MPLKFNPFTAQFDLTGSGGGGAQYIDGEVAVYADLSLSSATAPLDSAWLVRTASGVWPVARKQAGIYIRTATGGSNRDSDYTYAGTMPDVFSDANFTIYDNSDTSKNCKFQLSGITTGTTRTLTIPDANVTLPNQGTSTSDKPKFDGLVVGDEVANDGEGYVTVLGDHKTQIVASSSAQTPLVLVGGSGTFEFWKDTAASRVISVGFATPGNSAGNSLVFSSYAAGVPWAPILEVPTGSAMDVKTGGIQFADSTTNSKKVLLSAANVSASTTRTLSAPDASGRIQVEGQPIGNTTPAAGTFTTLAANNGTLTASAPVLDLSQTWNNAAVTFTGLRFNATNTASAALSLLADFQVNGSSVASVSRSGAGAFTTLSLPLGSAVGSASAPALSIGAANTGIYVNGSQLIFVQGGVDRAYFDNSSRFFVSGSGGVSIGATGAPLNLSRSVSLNPDALGELHQRSTTQSQSYFPYNTYTNASNYERGFMRWSSNVLQIGTEKAGTGSARALELSADGATFLSCNSSGSTVRFGASTGQSSILVGWTGNCYMRPVNASAGVLTLLNNALDGFDRLQFGGTTSSFPALKRSTTALQVRLADDSAYSVLDAQLRAQGTAPATSGAAGTAGDIRYDADYIYVCTAASTWKRAAIATW